MITDRLRILEGAHQRIVERFGSSLEGHSARALKALTTAAGAVAQADNTFREPHRTQQINSVLASAQKEREDLARILATTDDRLGAHEGEVITFVRRVELDPAEASMIFSALSGMTPEKRAAAIRHTQDVRVVRAAMAIPAEFGLVNPEDVQAASSRLWAESHPEKAKAREELSELRHGLQLVVNSFDSGLRELRDVVHVTPAR
jgi:methylphosphotriester-DNA--protein-cysteine methyltransferase